MLLSLCGWDDAEERDEARDLSRIERAGEARHRRPRPALHDEPGELLVGEAAEHGEVAQRRRPHGKDFRERTIASPVAPWQDAHCAAYSPSPSRTIASS